MQDICKEHYESLINDTAWSPRARELFVAIQYSASVSYSELENDETKREGPEALVAVDLFRNGAGNHVEKKNCQSVHILRNHLFDFENERELYMFAQKNTDDMKDNNGHAVTVADPGTEDEYLKRLTDAAQLTDGSVAPVAVRRLEGGRCVTDTVRPSESFVVEKATQVTWVQSLYEIYSWFIRVQGQPNLSRRCIWHTGQPPQQRRVVAVGEMLAVRRAVLRQRRRGRGRGHLKFTAGRKGVVHLKARAMDTAEALAAVAKGWGGDGLRPPAITLPAMIVVHKPGHYDSLLPQHGTLLVLEVWRQAGAY